MKIRKTRFLLIVTGILIVLANESFVREVIDKGMNGDIVGVTSVFAGEFVREVKLEVSLPMERIVDSPLLALCVLILVAIVLKRLKR